MRPEQRCGDGGRGSPRQYGLTERINADGHVSVGAARVVRKALPNASYIGFTGTPISTDDRNTREIFGDYIDV